MNHFVAKPIPRYLEYWIPLLNHDKSPYYNPIIYIIVVPRDITIQRKLSDIIIGD